MKPFDLERFVEADASEHWTQQVHESWRGDDRRCVACRKPIANAMNLSVRGGLRCKECSLKAKAQKKVRDWARYTPELQRVRYAERKAARLCVRCGTPCVDSGVDCLRCREKAKLRRDLKCPKSGNSATLSGMDTGGVGKCRQR